MKALCTVIASLLFAVHLSGEVIIEDPSPVKEQSTSRATFEDVLSTLSELLETGSTKSGKRRGYSEIGNTNVVDQRGTQPRIRRLKKFKRGKKITRKPKKELNRRERWKAEKLQRQLAYSPTESYPAFETIPIRSETKEVPAWENDEELRKMFDTSVPSEDADEYESSALEEDDEEQSSEDLESSADRHRSRYHKETTKKPTTSPALEGIEKSSTQPKHRPTESSPIRETTPMRLKEESPQDAGSIGGTLDDDEELRKILGETYSSEDAEEYESSVAEEDYSEEDDEKTKASSSQENPEKSSEDSGPLIDGRKRQKEAQTGKKKPMSRRQLRKEKQRMKLVYHAAEEQPTPKPKRKCSKKERQPLPGEDGCTLDNDKELQEFLGSLPPDSSADGSEPESAEEYSVEDEEADDGLNSQPEFAQTTLRSVADKNERTHPRSGLGKNKNDSKKDRNDGHEQRQSKKKKDKKAKPVAEKEDDEEESEVYWKNKKKGGPRVPRLKVGETKKGAQWAKDLKLDDIKGPKRVRNLLKFNDPDGW